jgi:hypothetical protein
MSKKRFMEYSEPFTFTLVLNVHCYMMACVAGHFSLYTALCDGLSYYTKMLNIKSILKDCTFIS